MAALAAITELVRRFREHHDVYTSGFYNETQLRREFLDPFFEALGWDIFNKQGFAEAYKDVIHEDAIKVGAFTKAPDYCFRVGGTRKFFVEAKKPSVNVKDDLAPAFQVRRYAWSAKLPLSILTDFEEFAVYDCRVKPDKADKSSTARILYLTYTDFEKRWDEIEAIFSKDAVLKGSFDKFAHDSKGKKGTTEVDTAFLKEIESWREVLARNIALRNSQLSQRELNFAVQQTIDRIIFLRICEDRGMETEGKLAATTNGANVYKRLCDLFRLADNKYNSGLFHFRKEAERDLPDEMTLSLEIDDKPLKDIIKGLYYPDCPYEFSVISSDILGQVYEQFLGKVIRLTDGHRAVVEDKPEVKKAGGVYYTPTYIVDYIVKNTVGKLLAPEDDKTVPPSKKVKEHDSSSPPPLKKGDTGGFKKVRSLTPKEASQLRILDPACGSGSFLIGAYQHLLDWHLAWYAANNPQKHATGKSPALYQGHSGDWKLTLDERKRILLNNIYGVDIDPQAVEVTKLSLLLKVLEGESEQTASVGAYGHTPKLIHTRVLPDLDRNIKCGNSLIGPDFYAGRQTSLFNDEERLRINVFDWKSEFPEIMKSGGFDAVIGNPPYIRIQALKEWAPVEVEIYKQQYASAKAGNYDIYVVFVEKGLSILNLRGRLGYILPSKFFTTDYGRGLREIITAQNALADIIDFGHAQVFETATTYTCLLFLSKMYCDGVFYSKIDLPQTIQSGAFQSRKIKKELFTLDPWVFSTGLEKQLLDKIFLISRPLSDLPTRIGRGSSSGADDVFMLAEKDGITFTREGQRVDVESDILRIPIYATDFSRYSFAPKSNEVIIFPYDVSSNGYELKSKEKLQNEYPLTYAYLLSRKKQLETRKQYKEWYGFSAPRNLDVHDTAQLIVPLLADKGLFCRLPENTDKYCLMASGGFSLTIQAQNGYSQNYVLGILNSKLSFWRLRSISNVFRAGWITCTKQYVETLPIRIIDFSDPADKARHDRMVEMVEQMLALNKQLAATNTAHEKTALQRQIDATDRQIDQLVYELYGLTEEEIRIVEGQ